MIGLISQLGYVVAYGSVGLFVDFIIKPFLRNGGGLAQVTLSLIGRGEGRSAALMIIIVGLFLIFIAIILSGNNEIKRLEDEHLIN